MTVSQSKKVSVILPNYNYAMFINKRIDSVLKQTYPIYELIILDDCSTDNSASVIEEKLSEIRGKYPDVKVSFVRNEVNTGKAIAQWKKGFELATGDYVWIAEIDDSCSRKFLEEAMRGFNDPDVVISYTESMIINSIGLVIAPNFRWSRDREKTGHYKNNYIKDGIREVEEIMSIRCTIPNVSAVVFKRKDTIPYLNYLEEALSFSQVGDWYFYVNVLTHGKICYNRKSLNKFRVHGGSVTNKAKNAKQHFAEITDMHKYLAKKFNLDECVTDKMAQEERRIAERMKKANRD